MRDFDVVARAGSITTRPDKEAQYVDAVSAARELNGHHPTG
jgi:hypothetical protein